MVTSETANMPKRTAVEAFSDKITIARLREDLETVNAERILAREHCRRYHEMLENDDACVCCEACGELWHESWFGVEGHPDWCTVCSEFWCADCSGGTAKCGCTDKDP